MVISSTNESRRRAVSFGRIELDGESADHPFELSRKVGLEREGITTLTWVYDRGEDLVYWSAPVEEFFGYHVGVPGFRINGVSAGADVDRMVGPELPLGGAQLVGVDLGDALLAPILSPIRAGAPFGDVELVTRVT